jgi:hypothetical protein
MRTYSTILLLLTTLYVHAQSDATFTVSKKKTIQLDCRYDTLAGNTRYYFRVYGIATSELMPGKFGGGEVWLNDTAVGIQTINQSGSPKKHLFELYYKKDKTLAYSRTFTVMPGLHKPTFTPPAATINVLPDVVFQSGIYMQGNRSSSKDSLISKVEKLLVQLSPISRSKSKVTVTLKVTFKCKGQTTTLSANQLKLSPEMITKIKAMEKGDYLGVYTNYHSFCDPPEDIQMGPYRFDIR